MIGSMSIFHWLVVLIIVALIFGTKKLRNIGEDLGAAVRGFKEGMKSAEEREAAPPQRTLEASASPDEPRKDKVS